MRHSSIIERDIAIYTQRLALDSLVRGVLTKRKLKEFEAACKNGSRGAA